MLLRRLRREALPYRAGMPVPQRRSHLQARRLTRERTTYHMSSRSLLNLGKCPAGDWVMLGGSASDNPPVSLLGAPCPRGREYVLRSEET